ncbi:MAG: hypothetical protein SCALA702_19520 [Melioribacteraceae bacterium]|nr:MAG: hypothetical protein SCALA702_19520 [Melioribacteraceae bacterium]
MRITRPGTYIIGYLWELAFKEKDFCKILRLAHRTFSFGPPFEGGGFLQSKKSEDDAGLDELLEF